jgi:hypothetical protein
MFKGTCLVALERKYWSPRIFHLEILVYLIFKSSNVSSGTILLTLKHIIT